MGLNANGFVESVVMGSFQQSDPVTREYTLKSCIGGAALFSIADDVADISKSVTIRPVFSKRIRRINIYMPPDFLSEWQFPGQHAEPVDQLVKAGSPG